MSERDDEQIEALIDRAEHGYVDVRTLANQLMQLAEQRSLRDAAGAIPTKLARFAVDSGHHRTAAVRLPSHRAITAWHQGSTASPCRRPHPTGISRSIMKTEKDLGLLGSAAIPNSRGLPMPRREDETTHSSEILTEEESLKESAENFTPLRCMDCPSLYAEFPLDTTLPDEQWRMIHGSDGGVLCASCIVKRAAKLPRAIAVRARIDFGGEAVWWRQQVKWSYGYDAYRIPADVVREYPSGRVRVQFVDNGGQGDVRESVVSRKNLEPRE